LRGGCGHAHGRNHYTNRYGRGCPTALRDLRKYRAEVTRALKHCATLVVLNFCYRGNLDRDRSDIAILAADVRLEIC
jgi:hypothetical protein